MPPCQQCLPFPECIFSCPQAPSATSRHTHVSLHASPEESNIPPTLPGSRPQLCGPKAMLCDGPVGSQMPSSVAWLHDVALEVYEELSRVGSSCLSHATLSYCMRSVDVYHMSNGCLFRWSTAVPGEVGSIWAVDWIVSL